jgi:hypothetical protein
MMVWAVCGMCTAYAGPTTSRTARRCLQVRKYRYEVSSVSQIFGEDWLMFHVLAGSWYLRGPVSVVAY